MSNLIINNKSLSDFELIIFDKDGTLIDIHHYWCSMIKFRASFLMKNFGVCDQKISDVLLDVMGVDLNSNRIKPEGPVGIRTRHYIVSIVEKCLTNLNIPCTSEQVSAVFKQVDTYSNERISELIKPLSGIPSILVKLKENGILMAVATTDLTERAKIALNTIQIGLFFNIVAGGDLAKREKPSPDLVNLICKNLKIQKNKTIVIGDSIVDLKMAQNAGTHFIGVKTGLYTKEFIDKCEHLVENLEQIIIMK